MGDKRSAALAMRPPVHRGAPAVGAALRGFGALAMARRMLLPVRMAEHDEEKKPATEVFEKGVDAGGAAGGAAQGVAREALGGPLLKGASAGGKIAFGIDELLQGHFADGAIKTGGGIAEGAETALDVAGKEGAAKWAGRAGLVFDALEAIRKFQKGDVSAGLLDVGGLAFSAFSAPLGAAFKLGRAGGDAINANSATENRFGGNRTASEAAADTGVAGQQEWEKMGVNETAARLHGADIALGSSVINAVQGAAEEMLPAPLQQYMYAVRNQPIQPEFHPQDETETRSTQTSRISPDEVIGAKKKAPPAEVAKALKSLDGIKAASAQALAAAKVNEHYAE